MFLALPTCVTSGEPPLLWQGTAARTTINCTVKLTSPLLNPNFFRSRCFEWNKSIRIPNRKGKSTFLMFLFAEKMFSWLEKTYFYHVAGWALSSAEKIYDMFDDEIHPKCSQFCFNIIIYSFRLSLNCLNGKLVTAKYICMLSYAFYELRTILFYSNSFHILNALKTIFCVLIPKYSCFTY